VTTGCVPATASLFPNHLEDIPDTLAQRVWRLERLADEIFGRVRDYENHVAEFRAECQERLAKVELEVFGPPEPEPTLRPGQVMEYAVPGSKAAR
jgi:hypothetical protein